tara:strand:+ start:58054 stop:58983 length:930 start_codon:yes stop_codon:yes gene_type:complete
MKKLIFVSLGFCLLFAAQAQNLIQSTDTLIIRFGERIQFKYGLSPKPVDTVLFPVSELDEDSLSIINPSGNVSSNADFIGNTIEFTAFDSGLFTFPALPVIVDGDTGYTRVFQYLVVPAQIDTTNAFYDIKDNYLVEWTLADTLALHQRKIYLALAVLTLLILLYIFRKKLVFKRKEQPAVEEVIPAEKFEDWLEKKLIKMHADQLWKRSDLKPFYSSLNYVLRKFLEHQYSIKTLEKTSSEIIAQLRFTQLSQDEINRVIQSLNLSDMVKFAKENPTHDDNKGKLDWLEGFIKKNLIAQAPNKEDNHA